MRTLLTLTLLLFFSSELFSHDIKILDARIHEGPPSQKILAAYMVISNTDSKRHTITHITSTVFEHVEMHKTLLTNGIVKMQKQANLVIAAQSKLELIPGGYHLMLINPKRPIKAGTDIKLLFHLADGNSFEIQTPVIKAEVHANKHSHHH